MPHLCSSAYGNAKARKPLLVHGLGASLISRRSGRTSAGLEPPRSVINGVIASTGTSAYLNRIDLANLQSLHGS
jgi:hypothetical protein